MEKIEIIPQILNDNGFVLKNDGWLWTQYGVEFSNYIHIQFRKNGGMRRIELNFTNVQCTIMVNDICTIDWFNQLLRILNIEKQIKWKSLLSKLI